MERHTEKPRVTLVSVDARAMAMEVVTTIVVERVMDNDVYMEMYMEM